MDMVLMVEMVDTADCGSAERNSVKVQAPFFTLNAGMV